MSDSRAPIIDVSSRSLSRPSSWLSILIPLLAILLSPSLTKAQGNPSEVGEWGELIDGFPVPAVHAILLHTGKVLFFRGDGEDEGGVGVYRTHLLDLENFGFETMVMNANVFCAGHTFLPDGRVLVTGGELEEDLGPSHVHVFDPITEQWYQQPDMSDGRYYPTNVAMGDGSSLIFAGRDPRNGDNPRVERFIPGGGPDGSNVIEVLENADQAMIWYPRMHLLPNGNVFRAGNEQAAISLDPGTGNWQLVANSNFGERYWGTSVALPPGFEKIMILGGVNRGASNRATNTAEIIDLTSASPSWRYTNSMNFPRVHPNVIVLPNGEVFVAGGNEDEAETIPVFESEIFDPATETWTLGPSQASVRTYHSSSILLPDGRVMWLGAHAETGSNLNSTAQIYSPAYMFQGPRPVVLSAPESADFGESFLVDTAEAADIDSVVLIRPSATTHSTNMEQRYVPLAFSQLDADTLQVTAPTNPNTAPPGYYLLFIVDSSGRPSEAPFVRLGGDLPPAVEAGADQEVILPSSAQLSGTVIDYNLSGNLVTEWTVAGGPGPVSFSNSSATTTTATFTTQGMYTLRLRAIDGAFNVSDTMVVTVHPEGRTVVSVNGSVDDAEEKASGIITLTSLDLEMTDYDAGGPHAMIGLRFNNVDIANGTQIGNAYIQFQALETDATPTQLTIAGQASDDAPAFTTSVGNLTSRLQTAASAVWDVPEWTAGEAGTAQQTVNIAPVIQEIVNRAGWSAGNSLAILISGTGSRVAATFDSNPIGAARLHVDPAGSQACDDGIDNDGDGNADFPADAGCSSAADPSEWDASLVCDDGVDNDGDGFIDFPSDTGCVNTLDGSESEFASVCIDGIDNDGDGLIDYPEDPGCTSGNDLDETVLALVCDDGLDNDSDGFFDYPFDLGCDSVTDPSEVDGLFVFDFDLVANADDAEQKADGSITNTSLDLEMFEYDAGGPHEVVGLRYDALDVPQGARIESAYIQFVSVEATSVATNILIQAEASDDAAPFSTELNGLSTRPRTIGAVAWAPGAWVVDEHGHHGEAQAAARTDDVALIVQEIIDRPGWASGSALAFLLTGVGERVAATRDVSPDAAARLHVEYTVPGGGNNTAPNVTITQPADGTSVELGTELAFTGTANDNEEGDLSGSLQWTSNLDGALGSGQSINATLSTAGAHTITASLFDSGGLPGSDQITVTITDPSPPANTPPTVTITQPNDGDKLSEGAPQTFLATAADTQDGVISGQIVWRSDVDGVLGTGASVTVVLSRTRHTISASVTDSGGLTAEDAIGVTVQRRNGRNR